MSVPNTKATLAAYCLRELGQGAIDIAVTDDQVNDRIDEALQMYQEWHYDATEELWLAHKLTQSDIDNGYITLDDSILLVAEIQEFAQGYYASGEPLFNLNYQVALNELNYLQPMDQINYFMCISNYEQIMDMLTTVPTFNYSRNLNKLMIHDTIKSYGVGFPIALRVYKLIDPSSCAKVYNDRWLKKYCCALIKKQWGSNLSLFENVQLMAELL